MKAPFLFIFLFCALISFGQSKADSSSLAKGKNLELVMTIKTTSDQMKMDATITRSFDITDISNGNTTMEHKIKRLQFNMESMMANQTFDSDKESDRKGQIGKAFEKYLNSKYTMTIDPNGKVVNVTGDSSKEVKSSEFNENMISGMVEQMAGKITPPAIGETMELKVLPTVTINEGNHWVDSTAKSKTVYTVTEITGNQVTVTYTSVSNTEQKQEVMGQTINIITTDTTNGIMIADRQSGFLKQKASVTNSEGNMNVMGQSMPVNYKTTKTWTVK